MEEKEIKPKIIETYAEDMAKVIGDDREGLIKKIIQGEEEHEKEKMNLSPESKKNKVYMFLSFLLIILGISIFVYLFLHRDNTSVVVDQPFTPLIFSDANKTIEVKDLDKDQLIEAIRNEIETSEVKTGGVDAIYLTKNGIPVGLRQFITLIKSSFNPNSNLEFIKDDYLLGMVNDPVDVIGGDAAEATSRDFFMILKMRGLADIFPSIHTWENKMFYDLHGLIGVDVSADTNYLLTKNFEDGIIENKNARILYDNDHKVVLMYVFANDNSVVITSTEKAAHEIMQRLSASRVNK